MHRHFKNTAALERVRGEEFADYIDHATMEMIETGDVSITSIELGDFLEGRNSGVPVEFLSSSGEPLDRQTFVSLYQAAKESSRSAENLAHWKKTEQFLPEAKAAIQKVQSFVHGFSEAMPRKYELELNPELGRDPSQWQSRF